MKVLFLSNSDIIGGAARASYRIFESLIDSGLDVTMIVKEKKSAHENVLEEIQFNHGFKRKITTLKTKIENRFYKLKLKKYNINDESFISNLSSINLKNVFQKFDFDILHLHWISHEFLDLNELINVKKPIVWTLHDCWAFTGICHYYDNCNNYTSSCGTCPILNSNQNKDLSWEIWEKKKKVYDRLYIQFVTPSNWLGKCASESALLKKMPVSIIPYPIDIQKFNLTNKVSAKLKLGLNKRKKYILFGAMNAISDKRKGFFLFKSAFNYLNEINSNEYEILIFGSQNDEIHNINGYKVNYLGNIDNDKKMIQVYNASDVVVVPSMSENFSLVIMEALSCSVPVVAFDIGGNSDMIIHKKNGYLVTPYLTADLAKGIEWCLLDENNIRLSNEARNKALEMFDRKTIASKYTLLYKKMLSEVLN